MGYLINSVWTKMKENDIKKLNNIIDDKYCQELEIGRKINIMKKFEDIFDKEINSLYWDNIITYMRSNNWGYGFDNELQTKESLIDFLKNDFLKHGLYNIIELNRTSYQAFSGGFLFDMGIAPSGNYYVNIYFDIAHFPLDKE